VCALFLKKKKLFFAARQETTPRAVAVIAAAMQGIFLVGISFQLIQIFL